jgi:hypothetical protein
MFEHRSQKLLPWPAFVQRVLRQFVFAIAIVVIALAIGMLGYHGLDGMPWLDAFLNAAMILGGMGPVDVLHTTAAKIFAGTYALFAGVIFIVVAGLLMTPVFHRVIHHFHLELDEAREGSGGAARPRGGSSAHKRH